MSRLRNLRAIVYTLSRQPAACRRRLRSAGWSGSLWPGCVPRADWPEPFSTLRCEKVAFREMYQTVPVVEGDLTVHHCSCGHVRRYAEPVAVQRKGAEPRHEDVLPRSIYWQPRPPRDHSWFVWNSPAVPRLPVDFSPAGQLRGDAPPGRVLISSAAPRRALERGRNDRST
jgi:hypothetical protein